MVAGVAIWWLRDDAAVTVPSATPAAAATAPAAPLPAVAVSIDDDSRAQLDLATVPAEAGETSETSETIDGTGRVLDPLPLADAVLARAAARAALAPARSEAQRVRGLHRNRENASDRELEAADAAERKAALDATAAELHLRAAWGGALAERTDLEALIGELAAGRAGLVRIEVPAGVGDEGAPIRLALQSASREHRPLEAHLLGPAPTTDPLLQGRAWLVLIESDAPPPGTMLRAQLELPARPATGVWVWVPDSAIVRAGGDAFVFVETRRNRFERRDVAGMHTGPPGRLVSGQVAAGDAVVTRGAQQLLAAARAAD